jgi:peptidoglycan/xylan/chitin deacetylase (PgdA/CDA1 family)
MKIPGFRTLQTVFRWMRARALGGALILGYHRVANPSRDAYELCVTPEHFAEQLQVLKTHAHPLRLSKLAAGTRPRKSVALTFDDGYVDNLQRAKPLLETYQVPATFFICTGYLGKEFWWDELARLILAPGAFPQSLKMDLGGKRFAWEMSGVAQGARRGLLWALYRHLLGVTPKHRTHALEQIQSWRGAETCVEARALTGDELRELAASDWFEIGSHTVSHPVLAHFSEADQTREIQVSKTSLEFLLHRPVLGFSYPNGSHSAQTQKMVRQVGYAYACTSTNDVVLKNSDGFALPRFWVPDWDGARFAAWLKRWI